jgi:addiction module RelE/StbE family toxin
MKLIWRRRAQRDLRELVAYIAEDSIQGAELVAGRILKAAELITEFPRGGRTGRVAGTRERVVRRTPYILVYIVDSKQVRFLRVYHAAQKWPAHF